ncbi:Protein ALTERED XYLOGLUCAN 4 [Glycine soja]|uniref:Protein ALTERED XYLOGLUCAN 4 n=1 Tax=Glycine soja TaxID=3848 RepID=A0A445GH25_GLYSO|nr:Protein ALTERED XYLOGLUCAN 4 [Glycine soja]
MIMRGQEIYSSQDEATTSPSSSESEEAKGEESSEEIYPQEEGQPLMVKEECKEVSVSSKRLAKKESHFEINTNIKETSPLRQPPHLLLCKKTLVSTATPLRLEVIPQVKDFLDEGLVRKSLNPCALLMPKIGVEGRCPEYEEPRNLRSNPFQGGGDDAILPLKETELPYSTPTTIIPQSSLSASTPPSLPEKEKTYETPCDYFDGKWIRDRRGPLYNSTTCSTIKEGKNCITRRRPDSGYLYWRWKPSQCSLTRFEPQTFLQFISNKHVAFVGDSMLRNQLESLSCMLSTGSTPNLVYWNDDDNITVLSIGHRFLHHVVYYKGGSVLGCHYYPGLNHTEIGFYDVLRKALRTTLNSIIDRRGGKGYGIDVIVTTFLLAHFEGE